ncbi:MAG: outer membrane lipid asymmetry maintenance protein MlaD [Deltaproteobacteria bacterium]|nr:MAG: outer membrane lipid asymmetry maintenance protein MlaD [Deltaproteobacteria bacterium]
MKERSIESLVGIFVLIGIVCVGYLTVKLGKMEWIGDDHYPLYARFESVEGLKPGAYVEMSGVQVGKVGAISLDPESKMAVVEIDIRKGITLRDDVIASVTTAGLIGDKYLKLTPGGSDEILKPGDTITETESAINLEELIAKYVFGGA